MFLRYMFLFNFFALLVFLSPVEGFSAEDNFSGIEALKASTVDIFAKSSGESVVRGSGFFITENLLVTNYHLVRGSLNSLIFIRTQSLFEDTGSILVTSPERDLAIIKTSKNHYKPVPLGDSTDIHRDEVVFFIGSPNGQSGTVSEGVVVSKIGDQFLWTTNPTSDGASGSPLFSKDLRTVVGILSGSNSEGGGEQSALIISVDRLRALIEKNKGLLERAADIRIGHTLYERSLPQGYDFFRDIKTPTDMLFMARAFLYIEQKVAESIDQSKPKEILDIKSYVYWYERAALAGLAEAQYSLGILYHEGIDVEKNPEKRDYWLSKASEQGHLEAFHVLSKLRSEMELGQENQREIREIRQKLSCWD